MSPPERRKEFYPNTVIIVRNHNQLANQTKQKTGEKVNSIDTWARCRRDLASFLDEQNTRLQAKKKGETKLEGLSSSRFA